MHLGVRLVAEVVRLALRSREIRNILRPALRGRRSSIHRGFHPDRGNAMLFVALVVNIAG